MLTINKQHAFTSFVNLEKYINTYKYDFIWEIMRKIPICILLCIAITALISTTMTYGKGEFNTEAHKIVISAGDNVLTVTETLTIHGNSNQTYDIINFWVQDEAENINVIVNNNGVSCTTIGNNEYICNISSFNIKMDSSLQVTISYTLSKGIKKFEKTISSNTTSISVEFDGNNIWNGKNLPAGLSFDLLLYTPSETPLGWYIIVSVALLVILLIVSTLYLFRKQRVSKIKEIASGSEELLTTKKMLLMSLLKDIEKQHRSKIISDDTYHKLKEQYKQQAVETMKKLEDMMKSEIK